jgi:Tol biopolymer transport system component
MMPHRRHSNLWDVTLVIAALLITAGSAALTIAQPSPAKVLNPNRTIPGPLQGGLFSYDGAITSAAVSPDGNRIAYSVETLSVSQVWVADFPTGMHAWLLSNQADGIVTESEWSHDGNSFAYVLSQTNGSTLHVLGIPNGRVEDTTTFHAIDRASWNPKQNCVVFSAREGLDWSIYLLNATSSSLTQLTHDGHDRYSSWAADGSSILFSRSEGNRSNIWSLSESGSATRLTNFSGHNIYPVESPNGTLAFLTDRIGYWSIWTTRNGVANQLIFPPELTKTQPVITGNSTLVWSPNGHMLALSSGGKNAYVVNFNGTVIGTTNPLKPAHQQIYSQGTVYHLPTLIDLNKLLGSRAVYPMAWLTGSSSLLAVKSDPSYSLVLAAIVPTVGNQMASYGR